MPRRTSARWDAPSRVDFFHFRLPNPVASPSDQPPFCSAPFCPALLYLAHFWLDATDPACPQTSQSAPTYSVCCPHQCQNLTTFLMLYLQVVSRLAPLFYGLLRDFTLVVAFPWRELAVPKDRLLSMRVRRCKSSLDDSWFLKIVFNGQPHTMKTGGMAR